MKVDFAVLAADRKVNRKVLFWLEEAGGQITKSELSAKFKERFHFTPRFLIGDEITKFRHQGPVLKIDGEIVSLS